MSIKRKIPPNRPAKILGVFWFILALPLVVLLLPIIFLVVFGMLGFHLVAGILVHIAAWLCWCARGKCVLLVYSDSPIWHEYFEREILPQLSRVAIVLNWSERRRWRSSLAVFAFRYFGGGKDFNPLAVVFRPARFAQCFRFYQPFREFKHGKPEAVEKLRQELLAAVPIEHAV